MASLSDKAKRILFIVSICFAFSTCHAMELPDDEACKDFYPTTGIDDLLTQFYNHFGEPCVNNIHTNHFDQLGVLLYTYDHEFTPEKEAAWQETLNAYEGDFVLKLSYSKTDDTFSDMSILPSPKLVKEKGAIFYERKLPVLPVAYEGGKKELLVLGSELMHDEPVNPKIGFLDYGEFNRNWVYYWNHESGSYIQINVKNYAGNEEIYLRFKEKQQQGE